MSGRLKIHIVSFDVPWPDNYGGVIDVFHKLRHLHALGAEIVLHAFTYGRQPAEQLKQYCSEVYYYPRKHSRWLLFQRTPFIVSSRVHDQLIHRIHSDEGAVLLEGLHCTAQFKEMQQRSRMVMVRAHNVEHDYYRQLAVSEKNIFRRVYLEQEANKLELYEPQVMEHLTVAALSTNDYSYFSQRYPRVMQVNAFHPNDRADILPGRGKYFLYQGNLGVSENRAAAEWLLREVVPHLKFPLIIAGQKIPTEMIQHYKSPAVHFEQHPTAARMDELISEAQVHLLPATQNTGIKLKLLNALFRGRHVVANTDMCNEGWLQEICHIADQPADFAAAANEQFIRAFEISDIRKREDILQSYASNERAAKQLFTALQTS